MFQGESLGKRMANNELIFFFDHELEKNKIKFEILRLCLFTSLFDLIDLPSLLKL